MTSPAAFAQGMYQLPSSSFDEPALVNPGQEPGQLDAPPEGGSTNLPTQGSALLMAALSELEAARPAYELAEKMYDGDCGDLPASQQIARLIEKSGIDGIEDLNYARVPVDTITEKLGIRAVVVVPRDNGDAPAGDGEVDPAVSRAQDLLDGVRRHNQMDTEEPEAVLRAGRYGDCYLEVWPAVNAPDDYINPDDEDGLSGAFDGTVPLEPGDTAQADMVDIYVNSPLGVRAFYDPEQPLRMTHVIKWWEWTDSGVVDAQTQQRATIYTLDRIERWVCKPKGNPSRPEDWRPYIDPADEDAVWPAAYPDGVDRIPFFHMRNARSYGIPEHKPAYGGQRLINKLISAHAVTIDFQTFPQRYALLDPKADDALINYVDPDNPEDEDDDPEGDGRSQLRADPAAVWKLRAQSVGQFSPADPEVFLKPLDRYIKSISELCGIPLDRFVGYSTPPSAESRKVGNEVLNEKARARRRRYGGTLTDAYEFALQLLGVPDATVTIKWEPLDAAVGTQDWEIVSAKIASGVPVHRALVEAGYDEDEVKAWLLDQGGVDLVRRVALLNSIGTAVQTLAAGVGVGLVSREQAGDLVARVLGQVREELPDLPAPVELEVPPVPPGPAGPPAPPGRGGGDEPAPAMPAPPPPPPPISVGVG